MTVGIIEHGLIDLTNLDTWIARLGDQFLSISYYARGRHSEAWRHSSRQSALDRQYRVPHPSWLTGVGWQVCLEAQGIIRVSQL